MQDLADYLPRSSLLRKILPRWGKLVGYKWMAFYVCRQFMKYYSAQDFDLLWVNQQVFVTQDLISKWSATIPSVVYINDNPFARVNGRAWDELLNALPSFTVVGVVRDEDAEVAKSLGCSGVKRIWMSYDEEVHRARDWKEVDRNKWASEVLFVGSYMPERGPFLKAMIDAGIPLTIYGSHWDRSKEWPVLKSHWKGGWIAGADYVGAVQNSKIVLGLLSEANKDYHTQRTMEVPYIGSLFCCKRTHEHQELYEEDVETVMWDDVDEAIRKCRYYLDNPSEREAIAQRGQQRVIKNNTSNQFVATSLLDQALASFEK